MDEVGKKNDNGQVASAPQGAEAADGGLVGQGLCMLPCGGQQDGGFALLQRSLTSKPSYHMNTA